MIRQEEGERLHRGRPHAPQAAARSAGPALPLAAAAVGAVAQGLQDPPLPRPPPPPPQTQDRGCRRKLKMRLAPAAGVHHANTFADILVLIFSLVPCLVELKHVTSSSETRLLFHAEHGCI
eukprot:1158106-Pelagomonas_calceolata.AAC.19